MDPVERLISTLPRSILVALILVIALGVILLLNPLHSVCDSQFKVFSAKQTPFLYLDNKKPHIKTTVYASSSKRCIDGNSLGACAELFTNISRLLNDLESGNPKCHSEFFLKKEVRAALTESMETMVRIAWGNEAPKSLYEKNGWLNSNHLYLFCQLKDKYSQYYGASTYDTWREKQMTALPNPQKLPRPDVWARSILSIDCKRIL